MRRRRRAVRRRRSFAGGGLSPAAVFSPAAGQAAVDPDVAALLATFGVDAGGPIHQKPGGPIDRVTIVGGR
eukprot:SAG22_NODE_5563_length_992_cov_1.296753_1_plen_71_part_00